MKVNAISRLERLLPLIVILSMLLTSLLSAGITQAAPLPSVAAEKMAAQTATTVTLNAIDDARTQAGSPATNFGSGYLWVGQPNVHYSFVQFDLSQLPADATITGAGLQLTFTGAYTGTNEVEVGRADGAWDELSLTWGTQPTVTWGGPAKPVTSTGLQDSAVVNWNVTPLVQAWHNGTTLNDGFVLRGNGGELKAAHAKETGVANDLGPKLIVNYTLPADDGQPRPDLGDAPDSTNHHGQNNTAYPGGILGQFPTVYNVPVNQAAGPLHLNQTMEGWLGDVISREAEADQGPDQDTPRNNILRNTVTGAIADIADNDRGDDGWRNRNLRFFNCERTQLDVRISKAANATLNRMYLNVWFDGNRDGDWADLGQCQPAEEQPAQASYEWIVQNYMIDMTVIPAGGSFDFNVITEKVFNSSGVGPHWMRFTLSEAPATQPLSGTQLPDGRGPHPQHPTLKAFNHGETEDVLQLSAPAGQAGTLEMQKRVITDGEPVEWIDYVTYEIRLRHNGGTEPLQARLRDVLPYPLIVYPTINGGTIEYIVVESATGGATPLQAQLDVIPASGSNPPQQVINWQGALAPNAAITFTFQVRLVALCQPNQQTMTFTNRAEAKPMGGALIAAEDSFTAKCIGYDESNIAFEESPILNEIDLDDLSHVPVRYTITNRHPISINLGLFQQPGVTAGATVGREPRFLERITLVPQATQTVEVLVNMAEEVTDELTLPDDYTPHATIVYCILVGEENRCPDAQKYPQLHGVLPVELKVRPSDLGDAPDSTNHAATAMAAYPGVQANFPTVFDPATGLPEGPLHRHPRPFHLGQRVSREAEADIGPDQDPLNNILPAANDPDNDRADDGTNFALWNLNNCQTTNLPVQVAITPQAVNYFQSLNAPGYLNIWIDSNRDGDWADAAQCGQQPAPEHIVIDFPVDVVALGAGLHTLPVPTGLVPWTNNEQPSWVRITLSEIESNKTLQAGDRKHGDGRGYPTGFKTGETEDYLYRPQAAGGGADIDVQMTARTRQVTDLKPGLLQAAAADKLGNFEIQLFKIDYGNIGSQTATGGVLTFNKPPALRNGQLVLLQAPGLDRSSFSLNFEEIKVTLMDLAPNRFGTITLGWYGCLTCTLTAANTNADITADVTVALAGDVDPSNNGSSATARGLLRLPIIGALMDYADDACTDRLITGRAVTNQTTVELRGKGQPNQIIAILIGLVKVAEVTSDGDGNFGYTATLAEGLHAISARHINSPRDASSGLPTGKVSLLVKPTLPYDPISTCFVDSNGRSHAFPMLGYSFGATQTGSWLRSGESYRVSVNTNGTDPNQYFKVTFEDIVLSSLSDEDRDGTFVGQLTFPATVQAAAVAATGELGLIVGAAGTESSYRSAITTAADGIITDRASGQPLANATATLLVAQAADDGTTSYAALDETPRGQPNFQVTAADGKYRYSATAGLYRIDVRAAGYQSYRSGTIDADTTALSPNIALTPAIADAATHTVYLTANGFAPATLTVIPGSVIEFVNIDLADHGAVGSGWDSGLLAPGASYKVKVSQIGTFPYTDSSAAFTQGTVVVRDETFGSAHALYLPLVQR